MMQWAKGKDLRCVVLCAGRAKRMKPYSMQIPKVLIDVNGKPVLHHVIKFWRQFTNHFIFVVGYNKEQITDYVAKEHITSRFIEQKELKGIAHAVMQARDQIEDRFIVVLGDCICKGEFLIPEEMDQGVGVLKTSNENEIKKSYSIKIQNQLITEVIEKPTVIENHLCGMGFYFFKKTLFDFIDKTPPSSLRNEIEITDVIQKMIISGEPVSPVWFNGDYVNINIPEDIETAEKIL